MSEVENTHEFNSYNSIYAFANYGIFGVDASSFTPEMVRDLIQDPMRNNKKLRELSNIVYNANGIVANTIDKMVALPTLDRVVVSYGKSKPKRNTNKEKVQTALDTLRDKELVRDCLQNSFVDGIAFYYVEVRERNLQDRGRLSDREVETIVEINEEIMASAISLPADYTKVVGLKNSSPVLAFNLSYFDEKSTEGTSREQMLRKFPREIRNGYASYSRNSSDRNNWLVLDNDHTICVKFRSKKSEPWGRPLALAALIDIYYDDYHTDTKRKVLDEVNNKVIYQTFPQGKETGTSALSTDQQRKQHDAVKDGVTTKNNRGGISFFSVAAGTKIDTIDTKVDLLDEKNDKKLKENISTSLGFAGSLLSGAGDSSFASLQENLRLVTAVIFKMVDEITTELNKVINACIVKEKAYPVRVFYLPITHANRKEFVGFAKELYLQGKGSLSLWAAAVGIQPDAFFSLLDWELEEDIENKYPVHQTSATLSKDDKKTGRPQVDDPTNENTVKSKTNNANAASKPSTS